jgi:hypothetical protein
MKGKKQLLLALLISVDLCKRGEFLRDKQNNPPTQATHYSFLPSSDLLKEENKPIMALVLLRKFLANTNIIV